MAYYIREVKPGGKTDVNTYSGGLEMPPSSFTTRYAGSPDYGSRPLRRSSTSQSKPPPIPRGSSCNSWSQREPTYTCLPRTQPERPRRSHATTTYSEGYGPNTPALHPSDDLHEIIGRGGKGYVGDTVYDDSGRAYYRDSKYSMGDDRTNFAMNAKRRDRVTRDHGDTLYTTSTNAMSCDRRRGIQGTHYYDRDDRRSRNEQRLWEQTSHRLDYADGGSSEYYRSVRTTSNRPPSRGTRYSFF